MELEDRPLVPPKPYKRPSYGPAAVPAPEPEEPSFVRRWWRAAAVVVVLAVGGYLVWGWFFSSSLGYTRVGPRPSEGGQVVVLLHGFGASGDDFVPLAEQLSAAAPGATFLLPKGPHQVGLGGRAWLPRLSAHTREELAALEAVEIDRTSTQLWALLENARSKGVACKDIYVGGFSQGGWMAAEVALRAPPDCPLGGVIVMSGGGVGVPFSAASGRPRMRVLVTHGTQDGVVPIGKGKATAQHFAAGDHEVQWLQFDGPHTVAPAVKEAIPRFLRGETVGTIVTAEP